MEREEYIKYIEILSKNIDPNTGEVLKEDSPLADEKSKKALKLALKCIKKIDDEPENSGVSWNEEEEKELAEDIKSNLSYYAIARKHERTLSAIESREDILFKKGLLKYGDLDHRQKNY